MNASGITGVELSHVLATVTVLLFRCAFSHDTLFVFIFGVKPSGARNAKYVFIYQALMHRSQSGNMRGFTRPMLLNLNNLVVPLHHSHSASPFPRHSYHIRPLYTAPLLSDIIVPTAVLKKAQLHYRTASPPLKDHLTQHAGGYM